MPLLDRAHNTPFPLSCPKKVYTLSALWASSLVKKGAASGDPNEILTCVNRNDSAPAPSSHPVTEPSNEKWNMPNTMDFRAQGEPGDVPRTKKVSGTGMYRHSFNGDGAAYTRSQDATTSAAVMASEAEGARVALWASAERTVSGSTDWSGLKGLKKVG